jgi:predicted Rossmann-fold nucleotide-binding protein
VFCNGIAKYFSNAIREDGLLARCTAGLVVLEGAAGTVQEVFQTATRLYYAAQDAVLPVVVLVGRTHWTGTIPVWPALEALGTGRAMAQRIHLVDSVEEAAAIVTGGVSAGS